jgi:hypothetical protein
VVSRDKKKKFHDLVKEWHWYGPLCRSLKCYRENNDQMDRGGRICLATSL